MKRSVIIAFVIFISVTGWFLSGTISIGNENQNDQQYDVSSNENNRCIFSKALSISERNIS